MNLMELLNLVDARLRPLVNADERTLQAVIEEVAAGPRPEDTPADVDPRTTLAAQLICIEQECIMVRELLHVEFTTVARVDVKVMPDAP